jgi:hypothetical protein
MLTLCSAVDGCLELVRKRGFEPLRPYGRQPLKLVRLPFRHFRKAGENRSRRYFAGAAGVVVAGVVEAGADVAAGAAGAAGFGAVEAGKGAGFAADGGAGVPLKIEPVPRWPMIDSASARIMNSAAAIDVAFVSTVAPERAPNAAWLLLPPNALAMSPPRPCCRSTTSDNTRQTSTNNPTST